MESGGCEPLHHRSKGPRLKGDQRDGRPASPANAWHALLSRHPRHGPNDTAPAFHRGTEWRRLLRVRPPRNEVRS
jgi:hypothetical protein